MKIRNAALSASVSAVALLAAQGVMAGGLKDPVEYAAEPMPITTSWHGFYLGAHIGAGEGAFQGVYDTGTNDSRVDLDRIDLSGVLAGGHVGYNWDFGRWILGVEADVSAMDWSGVAKAYSSESEEVEGDLDLLASIRGRVGIPVGADRSGLLYATGGVAFPDSNLTFCESGCNTGSDIVGVSLDDAGGVFGAGFEWAATENVRLRFETLYYIFDDTSKIEDTEGGGAGPLTESSAEGVGLDNAWTVRLGATWYVNGTR